MTAAVQYPNWFAMYADRFFARHLTPLAGQPGLRFLQIGAYRGDASVWLLDNILTGPDCVLVDVDTWAGSDELAHKAFDWSAVLRFYDERTVDARMSGRIIKYRATSETFFARQCSSPLYDFVYIDGAHDAYTVLNDALSAFRVLKPGGLLAFDDYEWQSGRSAEDEPKVAIDAFGAVMGRRVDLLEVGAQVWLRRVAS